MVACLQQQPVEAFSLPAWCAPVGLEKCHQQPARQAAHFCSYTSLLKEDYLTNTRPKQMWAVTKVIWGCCFFFFMQLIMAQMGLSRICRNSSVSLSCEMLLWQNTSCPNQQAGISPGCGFDWPEEWSLQGSGWHSSSHRCACIISWVFWVNGNEYKCCKPGLNRVTFVNSPLSLIELLQRRSPESASRYF